MFGRTVANWWMKRKKTADETLDYHSVVELLNGLDKSLPVSLSGIRINGVLFENTGETADGGPGAAEGDLEGELPAPELARMMGIKFKPYSEEFWNAKHQVYVGKNGEMHYIDFTSMVPVKKFPLGYFTHNYDMSLEFLVAPEQEPASATDGQSARPH
jgi:hypothetical protein